LGKALVLPELFHKIFVLLRFFQTIGVADAGFVFVVVTNKNDFWCVDRVDELVSAPLNHIIYGSVSSIITASQNEIV
jgi:hypothetical protein